LNLPKLAAGILILLLMMLPGCGSGERSAEKGTGEAKSVAPEVSKESGRPAGISVTPPAGWDEHQGAGLLAGYRKEAASFMVTRDALPADADTPDKFIDFVRGEFGKVFANPRFEDVQTLRLADHESRKLIFIGTTYGMEFKYMVVYVFRNGTAYTLTCGTLVSDFAESEKDFQELINSFKFL
jgi:hypothetical protein